MVHTGVTPTVMDSNGTHRSNTNSNGLQWYTQEKHYKQKNCNGAHGSSNKANDYNSTHVSSTKVRDYNGSHGSSTNATDYNGAHGSTTKAKDSNDAQERSAAIGRLQRTTQVPLKTRD